MIYVRLVAAFAIALATPALAQENGSRFNAPVPRNHPKRVFDFMMNCYVDRYPGEVAALLDLVPGTPEATKFQRSINGGLSTCLNSRDVIFEGTELYSRPERIRRSAARLLILRKPDIVPLDRPVAADAPAWFEAKLTGQQGFDATGVGVADFAHCVALANWPAARALVLAKPGSGPERKAAAALTPSLGSCVTAGSKMSIDPKMLQDVMAEAVWHVSRTLPSSQR